jgi:peptidoglycan DL-endopeptidase LytF
MTRARWSTDGLAVLALMAIVGCGGGEFSGPPELPSPVVSEAIPEPEEVPVRQESDASLMERWRAPFAVSSVGRIAPSEPRPVAVIGADPAMNPIPSERSQSTASTVPLAAEVRQAAAQPAAATASGSTPLVATAGSSPAPNAASSTLDRPALAVEAATTGSALAAATTGPGAAAAPPVRPPAGGLALEVTANDHEVQPGETWYGIAQRYRVAPRELAAANPGIDPERIRIGQALRIPSAVDNAPRRTHRVGPGDTLWGIARRYEVSAEEIRRLNAMADDRVRLDQTLLIP